MISVSRWGGLWWGLGVLLSGCAQSPPTVNPVPLNLNDMPMVQGNEIELYLRNSNSFWHMGVEQLTEQLNAQPPKGLDAPLRLVSVVMPRPVIAAEFSVRFAIDSQGRVIHAEMRKVSGYGIENMAAATFMSLPLWRFGPPMQDGLPTSYCCVMLRIEHMPY
jgi:hypothetical protein